MSRVRLPSFKQTDLNDCVKGKHFEQFKCPPCKTEVLKANVGGMTGGHLEPWLAKILRYPIWANYILVHGGKKNGGKKHVFVTLSWVTVCQSGSFFNHQVYQERWALEHVSPVSRYFCIFLVGGNYWSCLLGDFHLNVLGTLRFFAQTSCSCRTCNAWRQKWHVWRRCGRVVGESGF